MRSFAGRDILSLKDFERNEFFHLFEIADRLEPIARERRNTDLLKHKTMVTAFYQPSTRTRLAHEAAMWSSVPVINGGDGWGEHPTQILTDLYTVTKEMGSVDGKTFLAVGDHRMRTMHSLGYALSQFDAEMIILAPEEMSPLPEFLAELDEKGTKYRIVDHIDEAIAEADVIYMEPVVQPDYTQARQDKQEVYARTAANYQVTSEVMERAKSSSIILHSLPRRDELLPEVDDSRHARYWQEAYNGVVMRMALLSSVLGAWE